MLELDGPIGGEDQRLEDEDSLPNISNSHSNSSIPNSIQEFVEDRRNTVEPRPMAMVSNNQNG